MQERGQFTFYRSFWEAVKELPPKDRLPILDAIISYALDGEIGFELNRFQSAFFSLVKPNLDASRKKALSGKQGGSKRQANDKQNGSKEEANRKLERERDRERDRDRDRERKEAAGGSSLFSAFWEAYPEGRKGIREDAWLQWKELNLSQREAEEIIDGLMRWKRSLEWAEQNGRYVPGAAKFIRERKWVGAPAWHTVGADGRRGLDSDEIASIRRMMEEDST